MATENKTYNGVAAMIATLVGSVPIVHRARVLSMATSLTPSKQIPIIPISAGVPSTGSAELRGKIISGMAAHLMALSQSGPDDTVSKVMQIAESISSGTPFKGDPSYPMASASDVMLAKVMNAGATFDPDSADVLAGDPQLASMVQHVSDFFDCQDHNLFLGGSPIEEVSEAFFSGAGIPKAAVDSTRVAVPAKQFAQIMRLPVSSARVAAARTAATTPSPSLIRGTQPATGVARESKVDVLRSRVAGLPDSNPPATLPSRLDVPIAAIPASSVTGDGSPRKPSAIQSLLAAGGNALKALFTPSTVGRAAAVATGTLNPQGAMLDQMTGQNPLMISPNLYPSWNNGFGEVFQGYDPTFGSYSGQMSINSAELRRRLAQVMAEMTTATQRIKDQQRVARENIRLIAALTWAEAALSAGEEVSNLMAMVEPNFTTPKTFLRTIWSTVTAARQSGDTTILAALVSAVKASFGHLEDTTLSSMLTGDPDSDELLSAFAGDVETALLGDPELADDDAERDDALAALGLTIVPSAGDPLDADEFQELG